MGSAMAEQIKKLSDGTQKVEIVVFDKDSSKLRTEHGFSVAKDVPGLVRSVDTAIIAVKPQDIEETLKQINGAGKIPLVISIAAGITIDYLKKFLPGAMIVRAMPNLPAKIGAGVTGFCTDNVGPADTAWVVKIFNSLGESLQVSEDKMNAITAVSGSGPAYVCEFLQENFPGSLDIPAEKEKDFLIKFQDAAEAAGFTRKEAGSLVAGTFSGTIAFLRVTHIDPSDMKKQVASKGGTTEAALAVLESGGSLEAAVLAAKKRAGELSRG